MNLTDLLWIWPAEQQDRVRSLAREAEISPALARLLINRGIDDAGEARAFLNPNLDDLTPPLLMCGMQEAVTRIQAALQGGEMITVHGDYDADGITATVILVEALQALGGKVSYYLPSRFDEGYGLHCEPLKQFKKEGTGLVITVDCGINALQEVSYAAEIGLDIIISDHHQQLVKLPESVTVVNPLQDGCTYPFKELSGAGIAFKIACALFEENKEPFPEALLDLAALGTAADVVPLKGENRIIVAAGLQVMRRLERVGFKALAEAVSLDPQKINSTALSFILAPAINAAGRMGEADPSARLLLEKEPAAAKILADHLNQLNQQRRSLEQDILKEATAEATALLAKADQAVLTLASDRWHHGVIGIVASRLTEKFKRPVALIALEDDEGRGSARSVAGFDITAALAAQADLLIRFGGHEQAAGFTVKRDQISSLREAINSYACQQEELCQYRPKLELESELSEAEINSDLSAVLEQLEPYGQHNPEPLFGSRQWQLLNWKLVGADKRHLKLDVKKGNTTFSTIFFSGATFESKLEKGRLLDLAFRLKDGQFRGDKTLDLILKAFRYADSIQSENLELIDSRDCADREQRLKQLLLNAEQRQAKTVVFCTTKMRAEKINKVATNYSQVQIISGGALNRDSGSEVAADQVVLYDLPISAEQVGLLVGCKGITDYLTVHLLYGQDDHELNRKMLDMALPSTAQLEVVWKALAAALESGADGDFLQITADLFPGQFLPRFWEKVELILTECGLLQQGRLTESPGDNKVKLPERCSASCTYCETQNLRVTSEKFQQLMLQGSLEAIASALDNITIKGLKL
jgi:single-stranded-DNA-specific exonuclease RecJ